MAWRDDISDIIQVHNHKPSLQYWSKILNWAEERKDDLTLNDLEYLAYESERCRAIWNRDVEVTEIFHKNGKLHEQKVVKKGLDIKLEEVYPNIHKMIEAKIDLTRLEEDEDPTYPEVKSPTEIKLAAAAK